MKRVISLVLLLLTVLSAMGFTGCKDREAELKDLLLFQPSYVGEEVTTTDHTFKKDDFKVTAFYPENRAVDVTDFSFRVAGMKDGYYNIIVEWNGIEEDVFVPIHMAIYPSDME